MNEIKVLKKFESLKFVEWNLALTPSEWIERYMSLNDYKKTKQKYQIRGLIRHLLPRRKSMLRRQVKHKTTGFAIKRSSTGRF